MIKFNLNPMPTIFNRLIKCKHSECHSHHLVDVTLVVKVNMSLVLDAEHFTCFCIASTIPSVKAFLIIVDPQNFCRGRFQLLCSRVENTTCFCFCTDVSSGSWQCTLNVSTVIAVLCYPPYHCSHQASTSNMQAVQSSLQDLLASLL